MMNRFILLFILLILIFIPTVCCASYSSIINYYNAAAASGGADCSGAITLIANFENNDDLTQGSPAGCSDGDTTFTRNSGAVYTTDTNKVTNGTYALNSPTGSDYAALTGSNDDIFTPAEGSMVFDFGIETFASSTHFCSFKDSSRDNQFYVYMTGSNPGAIDLYVWWEAQNGGSEGFFINTNLTQGTSKYTIVVTWDDSLSSDGLYAEVFNYGSTSIASNSTADITAMDTNVVTEYRIGNTDTANGSVSIDNFQMKNVYDKTDWR